MMVQSSKVHGKISNDRDNLERKDWISNLPDAILCHILSFMPTRNAVQTGILSTRWKSLWTSVPILDLKNRRGLSRKEDGPGSFMDFVDRVLLLHNSPNLNRFLLKCGTENPYRLNSWISTAVKRHAQEVDLCITTGSIVQLPRHLFTSIDLEVLKLSGSGFHWSPLTVSLPRLKVLHLYPLELRDEGFINNLLSGCPVLEEFEIDIRARGTINTIHICSSTLKKLLVYNEFSEERSAQRGILIKAPSLETLELHDELSTVFEVEELPALVKAGYSIRFNNCEVPTEGYCNAVVQMVAKASNVQRLWLDESTLKVVTRASAYNQLIFRSLTHLDICIHDLPWSVVPDLLGHIPSLIVLVMKTYRKCGNVCLWTGTPENVPTCLSLNLEKIEFHGFSGCNKEMKLAKYLLENAMVLKKLTLHCWSRSEKIKTDLQKYKRGSSTCQIKFWHRRAHVKSSFGTGSNDTWNR